MQKLAIIYWTNHKILYYYWFFISSGLNVTLRRHKHTRSRTKWSSIRIPFSLIIRNIFVVFPILLLNSSLIWNGICFGKKKNRRKQLSQVATKWICITKYAGNNFPSVSTRFHCHINAWLCLNPKKNNNDDVDDANPLLLKATHFCFINSTNLCQAQQIIFSSL